MKCLCYLTRDGRATGNALLSYKCLENCNLQPRPHGNNKHSQSPYMRTYPSTLLKIKERIGSQSPAAIWNELSVDSTGNMDAQATLRDRKQVYNARSIRRKSPGILLPFLAFSKPSSNKILGDLSFNNNIS